MQRNTSLEIKGQIRLRKIKETLPFVGEPNGITYEFFEEILKLYNRNSSVSDSSLEVDAEKEFADRIKYFMTMEQIDPCPNEDQIQELSSYIVNNYKLLRSRTLRDIGIISLKDILKEQTNASAFNAGIEISLRSSMSKLLANYFHNSGSEVKLKDAKKFFRELFAADLIPASVASYFMTYDEKELKQCCLEVIENYKPKKNKETEEETKEDRRNKRRKIEAFQSPSMKPEQQPVADCGSSTVYLLNQFAQQNTQNTQIPSRDSMSDTKRNEHTFDPIDWGAMLLSQEDRILENLYTQSSAKDEPISSSSRPFMTAAKKTK